MGATTFVDKVTVINTDWLNDVNGVVWTLFGGTTSPSAARTALGLGTMATQSSNSVAISGGTISGATISTNSATISGGTIGGITSLGVNTPSGGTVPLTVAGSSGNGQIRALHSTGSGLLINQSSAAGAINILQQDNDAINFGTNNSTSLVLQSNGDVLVNRATSGTRAFVVQNTDAASVAAATSYLQTDAGLFQMTLGAAAGGGTASLLSSTTGVTNIYTTTATSLQLGTNNVPNRLVINSAGEVAIGGALSVSSTISATGNITENVTRVFSRNSAGSPAGQDYTGTNTIYTFAHGLGQVPISYSVWMDCIDASGNTSGSSHFPLGHRIFLNTNASSTNSVTITADTTNVYVRVVGNIVVQNPGILTNTVNLIFGSPSKWNIKIRAWY